MPARITGRSIEGRLREAREWLTLLLALAALCLSGYAVYLDHKPSPARVALDMAYPTFSIQGAVVSFRFPGVNNGDAQARGCFFALQAVDDELLPYYYLPTVIYPDGSPFALDPGQSRFVTDEERPFAGYGKKKFYFEAWVECSAPTAASESWFFEIDPARRSVNYTDRNRPGKTAALANDRPWPANIPSGQRDKPCPSKLKGSCDLAPVNR